MFNWACSFSKLVQRAQRGTYVEIKFLFHNTAGPLATDLIDIFHGGHILSGTAFLKIELEFESSQTNGEIECDNVFSTCFLALGLIIFGNQVHRDERIAP